MMVLARPKRLFPCALASITLGCIDRPNFGSQDGGDGGGGLLRARRWVLEERTILREAGESLRAAPVLPEVLIRIRAAEGTRQGAHRVGPAGPALTQGARRGLGASSILASSRRQIASTRR